MDYFVLIHLPVQTHPRLFWSVNCEQFTAPETLILLFVTTYISMRSQNTTLNDVRNLSRENYLIWINPKRPPNANTLSCLCSVTILIGWAIEIKKGLAHNVTFRMAISLVTRIDNQHTSEMTTNNVYLLHIRSQITRVGDCFF